MVSAPAYTFTVTVLEPSAVPRMSGVPDFDTAPSVGWVTVTAGAAVSTVNVAAALVPTLPEVSNWVACTVYVPSASAAAVADQAPPVTSAAIVCTAVPVAVLPAYSFTDTWLTSPAAVPAAPRIVGVAEPNAAPSTGAVNVTTGALDFTLNVTAADVPTLPDPSV